jgi:hypothetical protein
MESQTARAGAATIFGYGNISSRSLCHSVRASPGPPSVHLAAELRFSTAAAQRLYSGGARARADPAGRTPPKKSPSVHSTRGWVVIARG